ncbi:MAG TPA: 30S ribosomal protein S17 [Nitrospinota bacterium]|jgi:small subunit ribosomal protein S17|nr:30S ribosomal protein S17 [Nitrospinota bacterium]|tara:strand:- start:219819 stop:220085 length:267 start_codon:yes stop_codon:yes gene_type:complete
MVKKRKSNPKTREGVVVSNKMDKSAVVRVDRRVPHPVFKKIITLSAKYMILDEKNQLGIGDKVRIIETRPLSKRKRWRLGDVLEKALS